MTCFAKLAPAIFALMLIGWGAGVQAQIDPEVARELRRLETALNAQAGRLAEQERALAEQKSRLDRQAYLMEQQSRVILALRAERGDPLGQVLGPDTLAMRSGGGAASTGARATRAPVETPGRPRAPPASASSTPGLALAQAPPTPETQPQAPSATRERAAAPVQPVGEAPPEGVQPSVQQAALPEGAGVLTPRGGFVFDPSVDFTRASTNRLVFRGVEIFEAFNIGRIEASDADRNTAAFNAALRYGVTNRLELEARVPFVHRSDRVVDVVQREDMRTRISDLNGSGVGDVELGARYQLSRIRPGRPIFIGGLRVKSDTGTGPFETERDPFGVAMELPTGSGFWAVEPSLSFLYPSDPAVIFGGVSYLAHLKRDVGRTIGEGDNAVRIGEVDPGDSLGANLGFGFALNPSFSISVGYRHNYVWPTRSVLNGVEQSSQALQIGVLSLGGSYRLGDRLSLSTAVEIGATEDAPDVRIVFRTPLRFTAPGRRPRRR